MGKEIAIPYERDEKWYGGCTSTGSSQPFGNNEVEIDLWGENRGNQSAPLLLSTRGRWVWCEGPVKFRFSPSPSGGTLSVSTRTDEVIITGKAGDSLPDAARHCSRTFFPPAGGLPPREFFTRPQYNTWIELMYDQEEAAILEYARNLLDAGYPPGILMIDDNWQENYGDWRFSARRFNNPKGLIKELHSLGFIVMLWMCPFVSADSPMGRKLAAEGVLMMESGGDNKGLLWTNTNNKPALVRWWNGASYVLDLSHPGGKKWFESQMDRLCRDYGVDGFKLDAGDARFYHGGQLSYEKDTTPNRHMELYAEMGLRYPYNELRACWKLAGQPLVQRLHDKKHDWDDLAKLIPDTTVQSLLGYGFTCPDMIGGGEYLSFLDGATIDQELFIRSAQASALMPMMQYSAAPWRVLESEAAALCLKAAHLHEQFGSEIYELAKNCARTGEPPFRSMEYNFPRSGMEEVTDQFCLGDTLLVAPVLTRGARTRVVRFPKGIWIGDDSRVFTGPCEAEIEAPLDRLPYFRKG